MCYDVIVPAGETGAKEIVAYVYYNLGAGAIEIKASPDPLVLDNLAKTLEIVSLYGTATPAVGIHTNVAGTVVPLSVSDTAYVGSTQYVCTGWSMVGNEPASGTANSFSMTVTNHAVLTWNWGISNIAPVVAADLQAVGYRTKANIWPLSSLLSQSSDPDGDLLTVSVTAANTNGTKGLIINSGVTLTYTPPEHTDAITDTFTYTVTDSKGASAVGTVKVQVFYGGTMIRAR